MGRLRAALVALVLAPIAMSAPTAAEPDVRTVVGGPLLGRPGVVVDRTPGTPPLPKVGAAAWLVADAGTGEVLAARDPHGRHLPASTLKTLTAVALMPHLDFTAKYEATWHDANIEGSKVGLVAGTRYTVGSLFESMLMVSGNDSAAALAGAVGGMARAVALMNAEARRLQAFDTVARNTSGLDAPGQVTSAYDLALIGRAGMAMPKFAQYVGRLRSGMPTPNGRRFETYNHNKLLTRYRGAIGVKTGYTIAARHTYVGAARRSGRTILVTLLRAEQKYADATALLDWGFAAAGRVAPVGRLVDPLSEDPDTAARAARTRDRRAPAPAAAPAAQSAPVAAVRPGDGGGMPVLPVAGGAAIATGAVVLRRRAARRRRLGPPSRLRLRLPVR